MAKGKKKKGKGKGGRRSTKKAKRVRHKKPIAVGTAVGGVGTGYNIFLKAAPAHKQQVAPLGPSSVDFLVQKHIAGYEDSMTAKLGDAYKAAIDNARDLDNWKPLAIGFVASHATKIPVVNIVAKPVDRLIRRVTGGKGKL